MASPGRALIQTHGLPAKIWMVAFSHATAQTRRGQPSSANHIVFAPSFSPYRPFAASPIRRFARSPFHYPDTPLLAPRFPLLAPHSSYSLSGSGIMTWHAGRAVAIASLNQSNDGGSP